MERANFKRSEVEIYKLLTLSNADIFQRIMIRVLPTRMYNVLTYVVHDVSCII